MRRTVILVSLAIAMTACSSMNSVVKAKKDGKGTTEVYAIGENDAWEIAKKSFRWGGTDAIEEHREDGFMLTSSGMNLVSSGAVMGAWIEPIDENHTKVTVITKRRISVDLATTLTEGKFHKYFAAGVSYKSKGEKLPIEKPDLN